MQSKDGSHSCRHAGASTRERLNSCPQSAASHMDFGNCDGNCCCTRIGVRDAGWQWNHPSSVSIARGTREVEAGHFDKAIPVTTRDEIGQLSIAFNRMIERLRNNERIRDIFGRYIDPRVAQDLLDQPAVVAT